MCVLAGGSARLSLGTPLSTIGHSQAAVRNFLIFRVGADEIEVVHIIHGARDYEPLLFPEE